MLSVLDHRISEIKKISHSLLQKDNIPIETYPFNEQIGLPTHPKTGSRTPLYPFQIDIINAPERFLLVAKSRKIGISEAIIRRVAQLSLSKYSGFEVLLVCQREENSRMLMNRLQELFWNSPFEGMVAKSNSDYLRLSNGCEIYSLPSTAQSLRGFPRVKGVYLDEAAHFVQLNDSNIYAALRPSLINTGGDFVIISTPRGQRGFFYKIYRDDQGFRKFVLPYTVAPGLIDPSAIEDERIALGPLFPQEYEAKFIVSQMSALGEDLVERAFFDYEVEDL